jgi:hypothetical protein
LIKKKNISFVFLDKKMLNEDEGSLDRQDSGQNEEDEIIEQLKRLEEKQDEERARLLPIFDDKAQGMARAVAESAAAQARRTEKARAEELPSNNASSWGVDSNLNEQGFEDGGSLGEDDDDLDEAEEEAYDKALEERRQQFEARQKESQARRIAAKDREEEEQEEDDEQEEEEKEEKEEKEDEDDESQDIDDEAKAQAVRAVAERAVAQARHDSERRATKDADALEAARARALRKFESTFKKLDRKQNRGELERQKEEGEKENAKKASDDALYAQQVEAVDSLIRKEKEARALRKTLKKLDADDDYRSEHVKNKTLQDADPSAEKENPARRDQGEDDLRGDQDEDLRGDDQEEFGGNDFDDQEREDGQPADEGDEAVRPLEKEQEMGENNLVKQLEAERALMAKFPSQFKEAQVVKKPKRSEYVAMNPAQQRLINFLAKRSGPITRYSWQAQLCIPPMGFDAQPRLVPQDLIKVGREDVQPTVIDWSKKPTKTLHLQIADEEDVEDGGVYLTFSRCVVTPIVDMTKPFETLERVLLGEEPFYNAQTEFAEYGLMVYLHLGEEKEGDEEEGDEEEGDEEEGVQAGPKWPAGLAHYGNSCYFNVLMLMLYQAKEWFLRTSPNTKEPEKVRLLANLKIIINSMDNAKVIPLKSSQKNIGFEETYKLMQDVCFPGENLNSQQDAEVALRQLFDLIEDKSDIEVTTRQTQRPSKEFITWRCGPSQVVPVDALIQFYDGKFQEEEKGVQEYTYNAKTNTIEDKTSPLQCALSTPQFYDIDQTRIEETQLSDAVERDPNVDSMLRANIFPFDAVDMCMLVQQYFAGGEDSYAPCIDENFHPHIPVRCHTTTWHHASVYLFVHLVFDPKRENEPATYCESIEIDGQPYDLICVMYRSGDRKTGHYTSSLMIARSWMFYDDVHGNKVINDPAVIETRPYMLLFKKRNSIEA